MDFINFQEILSPARLKRYTEACHKDTRKAMNLYRLNLRLAQEVFILLSFFEISLRNAIDRELTIKYGKNWLRDSVADGGIFDIRSCKDSAKIINKAYSRLKHSGKYSHHKLLAEMEFGIWKYMFANPQFRATGQVLLRVFPNKPRSSAKNQYNNAYIFNELDGINILRNRIAHHEPICFARHQSIINTSYIFNAYRDLLKLFSWMAIDSKSLLYGLDHVQNFCEQINNLK